MRRSTLCALSLLSLMASPIGAQSPPPSQLQFQARLTNSSGVPITTLTLLQVKVYDVPVGGAPLWSESHLVTPLDGVSSLQLGSITPIPMSLFDGGTRYLALQVTGDAEMSPRRPIVSVPYASRAASAAALDANAAIPTGLVTTTQVLDGTIGTPDLADAAVTGQKIAFNSITSSNLAPDSVGSAAIAPLAVGTTEIAPSAVTLPKITVPLDGNVVGSAFWVRNASSNGVAVRGDATSTSGGIGVYGVTASTATNAEAIHGEVLNAAPGAGSAAVRGKNNGTGGLGYGVWGSHAGDGYGVYGTAVNGVGVFGQATTGNGVGLYGESTSSSGVGIQGVATATSGGCDGARAITFSSSGRGLLAQNLSTTGNGYGVLAEAYSTSASRAVWGHNRATTGPADGVVGQADSLGGFGIWSIGASGTTGQKNFIQPHPSDPSLEIRFASLEGNESGTYFRGTSRIEGGVAVIDAPEEFRLVSEAEGVTAQALAVGAPATLWIAEQTRERIVVRGDRDVTFNYFVNGVRRGFAKHQAMHPNRSFVPEERGVPFGSQYPDDYRRILVESGILNPDFTPNEATAAKLGWTLRDPAAAR